MMIYKKMALLETTSYCSMHFAERVTLANMRTVHFLIEF